MIKLQYATSGARKILEERLLGALHQWHTEWCFKQYVITVVVSAEITKEDLNDYTHYYSSGEDFIATQMFNVNWRSLIFGDHASDVPVDRIYEAILSSAKHDLYSAVHAAFTCYPEPLVFKPTQKPDNFYVNLDSIHQLGASVAKIEIKVGKEKIFIFIPFSSAGNITAAISNKTQLSPITHQHLTKTVSAEVSIQLGEHFLSDINALEPGDILISTTPLNSLFTLRVGDEKIAHANLGSKGAQKAIILASQDI